MSERNGVPVSARRRRAGSKASRTASPHERASPAWCTSSRITSVLKRSVRMRCASGLAATPAYVSAIADEVAAGAALAPGVRRVERDADLRGGLGPLGLEVLGRRDHGDPLDDPTREQLGGDRQREGRLAGAGGRDREEVARSALEVRRQRRRLPRAQPRRRTPGGTVGIGGREVERGGRRLVRRRRMPSVTGRYNRHFSNAASMRSHLSGRELVHARVQRVVHEVAHRVLPASAVQVSRVVWQKKLGSPSAGVSATRSPSPAAATLEGVEQAEPVAGLVDHRVAEVVAGRPAAGHRGDVHRDAVQVGRAGGTATGTAPSRAPAVPGDRHR